MTQQEIITEIEKIRHDNNISYEDMLAATAHILDMYATIVVKEKNN